MRARAILPAHLVLAMLIIVFGGSLSPRSVAQVCRACASPETLLAASTESWTLRKQVNEVQVLFTASRHGKFITGLTEDEIKVRDNNAPAEIVDFRDQDNLPLRIALLVDTSDSIRERFRFEQQAAALFLRGTLRGDADQAMVAGFDSRLHVSQRFSHDSALISAGIDRLTPGGRTALFDAVGDACRMLARPEDGVVARVLIIVSDGDDNASRISRETAIALAQQAEVTIYTISTNYASSDSTGNKNLTHLASPTGGEALFPEKARNLARAFTRISEELRHRYAVAYRPSEFAPNGRFHRIRIQARHSGKKLKVNARQGYYAR
jgi:Ca-activated chloride channel homolog